MRIVTVTLNPAIDQTLYSDGFMIGATHRVHHSLVDSAGKGINVSKNLKEQGLESTIVGVFAGRNGQRCYDDLCAQGYEVVRLEAVGETRVNYKIVDKNGVTTELNEPGPKLTEATLKTLDAWIERHAKPGDLYVLAGSFPQNTPPTLYRELIEKLQQKQVLTLLDASSEGLLHGIQALPYCVKPNDDEIQTLLGLERKPHLDEMLAFGQDLIQRGIQLVVISLGKHGAYFIDKKTVLKGHGLSLASRSSVGAGDAMVGSIAYSIYHQEPLEMLAKRAIATSGAAVETLGTQPGSSERVGALMKKVNIERGV